MGNRRYLCRARRCHEGGKLDVHSADTADSNFARATRLNSCGAHHDPATAVLVLHFMESDGRLAGLLSTTATVSRLAAGDESGHRTLLGNQHSARRRDAAGLFRHCGLDRVLRRWLVCPSTTVENPPAETF